MLMGVRKESSQFHWSNGGSCQPLVLEANLGHKTLLENPSYPQWKIKNREYESTTNKKSQTIVQQELFSAWWKFRKTMQNKDVDDVKICKAL